MKEHTNHIHYVEFKARDLKEIKQFYSECFEWQCTDYGPDYVAFNNSGLEGGFERSDVPISNGVLVILYHPDLNLVMSRVQDNGGIISKDIFSFPGGSRFHFLDPAGNELAVWSDR